MVEDVLYVEANVKLCAIWVFGVSAKSLNSGEGVPIMKCHKLCFTLCHMTTLHGTLRQSLACVLSVRKSS